MLIMPVQLHTRTVDYLLSGLRRYARPILVYLLHKKRVLPFLVAKRVSEKKSCESRALSGVLLHKFSKIRKQMKAIVRPGRSFRMTLYREDGQ